jgi:DNA invertase Pin-like site-specific DNA recombinase
MTNVNESNPTRKGDSGAPVVIYAAKSTEDRRGSIPAQLEDCREMAARGGWTVLHEYKDEGFSAYRGNRGPGLAEAREHAARHASETGEVTFLLVQHSDRISRGAGDPPGAAEALVEIWHAERRRNVHIRSVQDDYDLRTSATVANIGERNRADSARKSAATRDGLKRRKESGKPVGAVPMGYCAEAVIEDGRVVTRRVVDADGAALVERIMAAL